MRSPVREMLRRVSRRRRGEWCSGLRYMACGGLLGKNNERSAGQMDGADSA